MELSLADDSQPVPLPPTPTKTPIKRVVGHVGSVASATLPVNGLAGHISINKPTVKNITLSKAAVDINRFPGVCGDDVGGLLSPGSTFSTAHLPDTKWTLFESVVFSFWDNILGPKIQHVWSNKNYCSDYVSMLSDISNHTLNGEICRDPSDSSIDTKFYHMNDRGYIVTAFIFTAIGTTGPSIHSLALVMSQEQLETYLKYHDMCTAFLTRHIAKLRILISGPQGKSKEDAMADFSLYVHELVEVLNSLGESGVPSTICLSSTALSMIGANNKSDLEESFLKRVIASHLMTCGHTVVKDVTADGINRLISSLALFATPQQRCCSRYVQEDQGWKYQPYLVIQGILMIGGLKETPDRQHLSISEIFSAPCPTTVVNVPKREVLQTPPCHEHRVRKHDMLKTELTCLWLAKEQPGGGLYPSSRIFQAVNYPESLVSDLFRQLHKLGPDNGIKERIHQFIRQLEMRALALIKFVEADTHKGNFFLKMSLKKLKQHLGLTLEGDFKIVLAMAEKLKPGMYGFVLGDPKIEKDEIQNILENF
ncbi:guanine nucleotide exchange factor C9orf72-like isoform X2 [Lineus longissimus]|uniref:guanine nucleotide exchange factor C9orf72-like isoform X2 n=1 Tax=Lineus longissimus TaxID=88925 RepID=UPI002B4E1DE3